MSYNYYEELPAEAKKRYEQKLNIIGLECCPYKIPGDTFVNKPQEWPQLQYPDLYHYLIQSPRVYSSEAMKNYRSLEAWRFFDDKWVQTILHHKLPNGNVLMRCDVRPSYRTNDDPHQPWICLSPNATVLAAHCDCTAGLGETCSHVAATLFKIEWGTRFGLTKNACTDNPCEWNQNFCKSVKPDKVCNITYYSEKSKAKLKTKKQIAAPVPTDEERQEKRQRVLQCINKMKKKPVALSLFSNYAASFVPQKPKPPGPCENLYPRCYRDYYNEHVDKSTVSLTSISQNMLSATAAQIQAVERCTRGQSSSTLWHQMRRGRVTASVASRVAKTSLEQPAESLIKDICFENKRKLGVEAVLYGERHEKDAFALYHYIATGENNGCSNFSDTVKLINRDSNPHDNCTTVTSGFVIDSSRQFLGASPDGIVKCDCCGRGVIEIKCPFNCAETSVSEQLLQKDFCLDENYVLKPQHKYYYQVQMQMYVLDVRYSDVIVWSPKESVVLRVYRDDDFLGQLIPKLEAFWQQHILPELVFRNLENRIPAFENETVSPKTSKNHEFYCVCRMPANVQSSEDMIGCDSCDNWFHLPCIKLKRFPKSKLWYCKQCKASKKSKK